MCFNHTYTRYRKCGSLEILGRVNSIFINYWDNNYFLVNRKKKDTLTLAEVR